MRKKITFIAPYPFGEAPSQRFRFEQYVDFLKENEFDIRFAPFLNDKTWKALYKNGTFTSKVVGILGSLFRRFTLMFQLRDSDYIFIHREAAMIGPPIFEWIIAKVLRKKYIYDFDDAIWLPNYSASNAKFHRLKAYWKVKKIIKWAHKVSAGNEFLKDYAAQYNQNVFVIPTTIDLENVHTIETNQTITPINIGWTGSHTTMDYLNDIFPVLKELEKTHTFTFTVISNHAPSIKLDSLKFVKWNKQSEISDLAKINIGVMPLTDGTWAEGKCGFKGLQYMALKIPAIMSPVGVNNSIIEHQVNGYLCKSSEEWKETLIQLMENQSLRETIGEKGYETVKLNYSVSANRQNYLNLFKE